MGQKTYTIGLTSLIKRKTQLNRNSYSYFCSFFLLLVGATRIFTVEIGGRLVVSEILCMLFSVFFVTKIIRFNRFREKAVRKLGMVFILSLSAWIIGDIINETEIHNLLRGWSRLLFIFCTFITFFYIISIQPNAILYYILGLFITNFSEWLGTGASTGLSGWRSIGFSLSLFVVSFSGFFLRKPFSLLASLAVAVLNLLFDYRTMAGAASISIISNVLTKNIRKSRFLWAIAIVFGFGIGVLLFDQVYLQSDNAGRGAESNSKRLAFHLTGISAIADRPLIGHGSWAYSNEYNARFLDNLKYHNVKLSFEERQELAAMNSIPSHSVILQSWVEGGFVASMFFFYSLYLIVKAQMLLFTKYVSFPYSSTFSFILIIATWDLCFTPLGTGIRSTFAIAMAICMQIIVMNNRTVSR